MKGSILKSSRARGIALAAGVGLVASLAMAPASMAAAGTPVAGTGCQSTDGKISGRGSTLQTWLQYDLIGAYASDVCGPVASQGSNDVTHPGSAFDQLSGGTTYAQNWMLAYNYPSAQDNSATGSGAGLAAIECRAESFAGTDIPATSTQFNNINTTTDTQGGNASNGKACDPSGLVSPFSPASNYPNVGDVPPGNTPNGVMLFPVGISAVAIFANLPSTCIPSGGLNLSTADMQNIWGGTYTNWDQITDAGSQLSSCNLAITRVVRQDNSGTTQAFDNYMADAFGYSTTTCNSASSTAGTFGEMQGNQANNGTDVNWPTGGSCSPVINNAKTGGPNLITTLETTNGGVGYADYSDTLHDTNTFKSQVSGNKIAVFGLTASDGTTKVKPNTSAGASNCTTTASLPGGGTSGAVGIGGTWNLAAQTGPNQGPDDISWGYEGSTYPICTLTWDFVWTGEDGNTPPAPTTASAVNPGDTTISVSSDQGLPNKGTFTVAASDGTDTVSYNGISTGTGNTAPFTLNNVTGDTGSVASGTTLTFPQGTGGPIANLTADQRRTLFSYFTYMMSDAAQSTEAAAGYHALPASWLPQIRAGFQTNY